MTITVRDEAEEFKVALWWSRTNRSGITGIAEWRQVSNRIKTPPKWWIEDQERKVVEPLEA